MNDCDCNKKPKCADGMTPEVVEITNKECPVLFHKVPEPASKGDDKQNPPYNGKYKNVLAEYEANGALYFYSSDGIFTPLGKGGVKDFNELLNRPKYGGEVMTGETDIPDLSSDIEALSTTVDDEIADRQEADSDLQDQIDAVKETADTAIQPDDIDVNVTTDVDVEVITNPSTLQLDLEKTNLKTGVVTTENSPLPVASSTQAGVMNSATYNAIVENTSNINTMMSASVAIRSIPANPTQAQLTTAWEAATGLTTLVNRASIFDVDNAKVWVYYTNDTTWHGIDAVNPEITITPFTNTSAGIIKGSTNTGQVFAENDGTGSVNGWDTLSATVNNNATKLAGIEAGAEVNVQSDWAETDTTADDYIKNKPTDFTGTDGTTAGTSGFVPAPAVADVDKFLKGDGTWGSAGGGFTDITANSSYHLGILEDYKWYRIKCNNAIGIYLYPTSSSLPQEPNALRLLNGQQVLLYKSLGSSNSEHAYFVYGIAGSLSAKIFTAVNYGNDFSLGFRQVPVGYWNKLTDNADVDIALSAHQGYVLNTTKLSVANVLAGTGITVTTAGSGANQTVTISATGGGGGANTLTDAEYNNLWSNA